MCFRFPCIYTTKDRIAVSYGHVCGHSLEELPHHYVSVSFTFWLQMDFRLPHSTPLGNVMGVVCAAPSLESRVAWVHRGHQHGGLHSAPPPPCTPRISCYAGDAGIGAGTANPGTGWPASLETCSRASRPCTRLLAACRNC